jgi:hypothetical protein
MYDPASEFEQEAQRSMNLLDFDANNDRDLFLLDDFSDRSEFGGLSQTSLTVVKNRTKSITVS